jgi:hypothetical protein
MRNYHIEKYTFIQIKHNKLGKCSLMGKQRSWWAGGCKDTLHSGLPATATMNHRELVHAVL